VLVVNVGEVREAMVSSFPLSLSLKTQNSEVLSLSLSLSYPNGGYINGYAGVFGRQIPMPSGSSFLEREIVLKKILQLFL